MDSNQRPDLPISEQINSRQTGAQFDGVVHGDCGHEEQYAQAPITTKTESFSPNNYTIFVELFFEDKSLPGAKCEITYVDGQPAKIVMASDEHGGKRLEDDVFSTGFFAFASAVSSMGSGQQNTQAGRVLNNPHFQQQALGQLRGGSVSGSPSFGPGQRQF